MQPFFNEINLHTQNKNIIEQLNRTDLPKILCSQFKMTPAEY